MAKRALSRNELIALGMSTKQVEEALSLQNQRIDRRFKYIVRLTVAEAEDLSRKSGKRFVRATDWGRKEEKN